MLLTQDVRKAGLVPIGLAKSAMPPCPSANEGGDPI
jgi:hypothetical protein